MALTGKQQRFVDFYCGISNGNATDAARRAGYSEPNTQGPRMLVNVGIQEAIKERYSEAAMSAKECLARLGAQARATLADVTTLVPIYEERDGRSCPWPKRAVRYTIEPDWEKMLSTGLIHQVAEIRWGQFGPTIKLHDVQAALDKIAKAHGIYKPDGSIEITNQVDLSAMVDQLKGLGIDELSRLHRETLGVSSAHRE